VFGAPLPPPHAAADLGEGWKEDTEKRFLLLVQVSREGIDETLVDLLHGFAPPLLLLRHHQLQPVPGVVHQHPPLLLRVAVLLASQPGRLVPRHPCGFVLFGIFYFLPSLETYFLTFMLALHAPAGLCRSTQVKCRLFRRFGRFSRLYWNLQSR